MPNEEGSLTKEELHHITEELVRPCTNRTQLIFLLGFLQGRLMEVDPSTQVLMIPPPKE